MVPTLAIDKGVLGRIWPTSVQMELNEVVQTTLANPSYSGCGNKWRQLACTLIQGHTGPHVGGTGSLTKLGDWDNQEDCEDVGPDPGY